MLCCNSAPEATKSSFPPRSTAINVDSSIQLAAAIKQEYGNSRGVLVCKAIRMVKKELHVPRTSGSAFSPWLAASWVGKWLLWGRGLGGGEKFSPLEQAKRTKQKKKGAKSRVYFRWAAKLATQIVHFENWLDQPLPKKIWPRQSCLILRSKRRVALRPCFPHLLIWTPLL